MEKTKIWEIAEKAGKIFFTFGIASIFGFFIGWWWSFSFVSFHRPMPISNMPEDKVPVLTLQKIENGMLMGSSSHEVRLVFPSNDVSVVSGEKFSVSVESILPMLKTLPAPNGALFVASKNGKKYYPLDHPSAFLLAPKNRVFYFSERAAQNDGKTKAQ